MVKFIGKGVFEQYSKHQRLEEPLIARDISKFLKIPRELSWNLIAVRQNRKLEDDELILNDDEIYLYFLGMGG